MNDKQIISSIQSGGRSKEQAVQFLIDEHLGFVHNIRSKLKIEVQEAKDCFTDAILGLIQSIDQQQFRGASKISTFLYQIFYFKCVDLIRKQTTNKEMYVENIKESTDPNADAFQRLLIKDEIRQLHVHLDTVGNPCKQILLDWGFWGYKMTEIARRIQLKDADQAKRKKYRCLQKLLSIISQSKN